MFNQSFKDGSFIDEAPEYGNSNRFSSRRYNEAYGDYRGGYNQAPCRSGPSGPPLGFGPTMFHGGPEGYPQTIYGRGFSGFGPPMQRNKGDPPAIKYLIRCGIPGKEVKNLPYDLLDQIEPQYCGLCGFSFDSFSLSRIHYLSKHHAKTVKKWVLQNNTVSTHRPHEAPLRARELYCEICDVQITSKVHAESHYEGKSHRAIVVGRKQPRNPMLLQPSMQHRLQQLIRREKKYIKKTEDAEAKGEEESKDAKIVKSDLYCEICKTAVSCSEQMTAHLNGKRHLTKEKNYILRSMKGEIGTPGAGNEAQAANTSADAVKDKIEEKDQDEEEADAVKDKIEEKDQDEEEEWQDDW